MIALPHYEGDIIRVPVMNGNKLLDLIGQHGVDLLKIDIEGHEHLFLSSIGPWLSKQRIEAMIFETKGYGDDKAVIDIVRRCSYVCFLSKKALRVQFFAS